MAVFMTPDREHAITLSPAVYVPPQERERRERAARSRAASAFCAREHHDRWRVADRNRNYSAFNGYRETWSAYSLLACLECHRMWRTRGGYVKKTPDISQAEREQLRGRRLARITG